MQTLIHHMKKKDHWECLDELTKELISAANNIHNIAIKLDDSIIENRQELPKHLATAMVMIEVARVKLCVLPTEWNDTVSEVVQELTNKHVNFDDTEF